jgi:transposase
MIGAALEAAESHPGAVVALFQDEATFYRQPTQASLWARMGRAQPHMLWSCRSNTWVRVTATIDAMTGRILYRQASKIGLSQLIKSYQEVLQAYPDALMIYLIQDNWPVHKHPKVLEFLARNPRLQVVFLPTYAPRLNPIEKLWRWAKQTLSHAHTFCDNFTEFKARLSAHLDTAAIMPGYIRHYCGLCSFELFL